MLQYILSSPWFDFNPYETINQYVPSSVTRLEHRDMEHMKKSCKEA